jgi:hypothetical protein
VISKQLQGDDLVENGKKQFGRRWHVKHVIDELLDMFVSLNRDGDDLAGPGGDCPLSLQG